MSQRGFTSVEVVIGVMIIAIVGISAYTFFKTKDNSSLNQPGAAPTQPATTSAQPTNPDGTILVQARDAIITDEGERGPGWVKLGENSRGFEAYIPVKQGQVTIPFTSEMDGNYVLWVYTSDDGLHADATRNATFFVNDSEKLIYQHKSRDTQGMIWEEIGQVRLQSGDNFVRVTKMESTSAAFSFTSIKFVPVE